ncbi:MAG: hypothetical protein AAGM38_18580 [Pseudomonadota bacterium]
MPLSIVLQGVVFPALILMYRDLVQRIKERESTQKEEIDKINARLQRIEIDAPTIYATKAELKASMDDLTHNIKGLRRDHVTHAREMHEAVQVIREWQLVMGDGEDDSRENFPRRRRRRRGRRRSASQTALIERAS